MCHLAAVLQLLLALPELNSARGSTVTSGDEPGRAWTSLVLDYNSTNEGDEISTSEFRAFLAQTGSFDDAPGSGGQLASYFDRFQNPLETFQGLCTVFGDVGFRDRDGATWRFGDVFKFAVYEELTPGPDWRCQPSVAGQVRWGSSICAQPANVPNQGAIEGEWLLRTPTLAVRFRDARCARCGTTHAFACSTRFAGLPAVLAIDFGAALIAPVGRRAQRLEPVRAPVRLRVPLGEDDVQIEYELFAFVELRDLHCAAFVRIGPAAFAGYDDGRCSYASLSPTADQVTGFISLAFYRQPP